MVRVGIIGATGYTGEELVRILSRHPNVKITYLSAVIEKEEPISRIMPRLAGICDIVCRKPESVKAAMGDIDLAFLALPHRVSMEIAPVFLQNKKRVIDLSADYRLSPEEYQRWYGVEHKDKAHLPGAVYGLPEIFAQAIKKAELIANPGCYPTGALLSLIPLIAGNLIQPAGIIIDAKSGVTGAGRKADIRLLFAEVNESIRPYKINEHQHKPEINRILSEATKNPVDVVFVPHLLPVNRGILSTIYTRLTRDVPAAAIIQALRDFYKGRPFVRISPEGEIPQLKDVTMTNYCDIGVSAKGNLAVVVACIDNLLKGAAGQAVQNMNVMFGFDETEGLL